MLPGFSKQAIGKKEMGDQIRIVIADDHGLFREMLQLALRKEKGIKIVGEADNGPQAIEAIIKLKPDIVLLGIVLSDRDGIEILPAIKEKSLKTKVLMLTANDDETVIFKALKAGAKGYVSKDVSISVLIKAIQSVHQGELWVERKKMARFFDREAVSNPGRGGRPAIKEKEILTPREKEILNILTSGCTNKEIAKDLFISEKTVKSHLNSIFKKLNISRRVQAILYAIERGMK
jgi:two-component system NarL family response regulator